MREIKFRGIDIDSSKWTIGNLVIDTDGNYQICDYACHESDSYTYKDVNKESVGEYTGIKDKNGKKIYEGDIIRKEYGQAFVKKRLNQNIGIVELCEYEVLTDSWGVKHIAIGWNMEFSDKSGRTAITNEYEVIGNIHENPELLK